MEVLTYYSDQLSKDVLVTMQQMLGQVGFKIAPRFVDVPTYNQTTGGNDFTMVYAGIGNGPDPDTLYPSMHSDFIPPNGTNRMKVGIPALNKLFEQGQETTSASTRTKAYQDMCSAGEQAASLGRAVERQAFRRRQHQAEQLHLDARACRGPLRRQGLPLGHQVRPGQTPRTGIHLFVASFCCSISLALLKELTVWACIPSAAC